MKGFSGFGPSPVKDTAPHVETKTHKSEDHDDVEEDVEEDTEKASTTSPYDGTALQKETKRRMHMKVRDVVKKKQVGVPPPRK